MLLGDGELLLVGVAGEANDFHAVEESGLNGVQQVGGDDEHHVGEVIGHAEVVIAEGVVLFGIENLEESGGWIAAVVGADLVDLVEHENGIRGLGLIDSLDDAAGERADVGSAMPADLRLVAHSTEGDSDELAIESAGDGTAQRCLAYSGRADEAEDRTFHLCAAQLAHGEVFEDALFDLLQIVVILVKDRAGPAEFEIVR